MSKYIKLEDAIKAVRDNTMPLDCWHIDRMRAIRDLPTIEVSEDCISREWLLNLYEELAYLYKDVETDSNKILAGIIKNIKKAPSVVPSCQKNRQVEMAECEGCKHYVYQLGCTHHATCEYEPKVEE